MPTLTSEQIDKYQRDGYLIIDTGISEKTCDTVIDELKPVWGNKEIKDLAVNHPNRIQCAWRINPNIRHIATHKTVLNTLQQLYQRTPLPFQTLNFRYGTEQSVHSDSIHFNSEPFGLMCGVWLAMEDIGMDQGPLIFYPGSNRLREINFPDMKLKAGDMKGYNAYLTKLIEQRDLQPAYGIMKKGQALIWSANLLHGGSRQHNKSLTRHSQVTHYYFEGVKCWRPTMSHEQRRYFEPEWITPIEGQTTKNWNPFPRIVSKYQKIFN